MIRFYKYLYYRLYYWNLNGISGWRNPDLAGISASAAFVALIYFNVWTLLELIDWVTGIHTTSFLSTLIVESGNESKIIIFVFVYFLLTAMLNRKSYWQKVFSEFDELNESKCQRISRGIALWLYALAWIVAWYLLMNANVKRV